ncbi:MAG: DUF3822 family protein [Prevotellaceae bacterium]|nr:DUF3822 family protein [Prevotellaceae bacterium]
MQQPFTVSSSTLGTSSSYHLSIQSNLNGLCFCVLDLETMQYVALQQLPFHSAVLDYNDLQHALHRTLSSEPLLNLCFASVACMYTSRSATLIPNILNDKKLLKHFLEFNAPLNELDEVHHRPILSLDAEAVFAIPSPLAAKFSSKYKNVKFFHQCVPMLSQLPKHGELLAVNINSGFADIALYARGELKIYNTFALQAPSDLAYFMLAIARQHKVNEKKTGVLLSGNIGGYVGEVAKLFPELIQAKPHTTPSIAPELEVVADHRFTHLFSLYECA